MDDKVIITRIQQTFRKEDVWLTLARELHAAGVTEQELGKVCFTGQLVFVPSPCAQKLFNYFQDVAAGRV